MNRKHAALFLATLALAACASGPSGPPPLDPVGTFDFTTTVDGNAVTGTFNIVRSGDGFSGTISTNVTEPIGIRSVVVEGQTMTVVGDTPDGPVTLTVTFTGDTFTGGWILADMSGAMTGRRRAAG
ncbi:MAG: hypothetical protein L0271_07395 [Gemmatimonadetes bacterium]|nr:hypothetical protein [Gemmatimonadota bacterium]